MSIETNKMTDINKIIEEYLQEQFSPDAVPGSTQRITKDGIGPVISPSGEVTPVDTPVDPVIISSGGKFSFGIGRGPKLTTTGTPTFGGPGGGFNPAGGGREGKIRIQVKPDEVPPLPPPLIGYPMGPAQPIITYGEDANGNQIVIVKILKFNQIGMGGPPREPSE